MKAGFMSSVCPHHTLPELIETARKYGYQGIEFRTEWDHAHGIELAASRDQRKEAYQRLMDAGIAATCIATSVRFNSDDATEREDQREILRKYVVLAAEVGAPYIRTFGDPVPEDDPTKLRQTLEREAESYALVDDWAQANHVHVLVETHGNLRADYVQRILKRARCDSLHVLWHIGHHIRRGQSVDEAYACIEGQVRHVHFSAMPGNVVTDEDNRRTFELLSAAGFDGFFSVEVINPPDPDEVLSLHIRKFREFLEAAQQVTAEST